MNTHKLLSRLLVGASFFLTSVTTMTNAEKLTTENMVQQDTMYKDIDTVRNGRTEKLWNLSPRPNNGGGSSSSSGEFVFYRTLGGAFGKGSGSETRNLPAPFNGKDSAYPSTGFAYRDRFYHQTYTLPKNVKFISANLMSEVRGGFVTNKIVSSYQTMAMISKNSYLQNGTTSNILMGKDENKTLCGMGIIPPNKIAIIRDKATIKCQVNVYYMK